MPKRSLLPIPLGWQVAAGLLLVLFALGLGVPSVRASISAWLGLSVSPTNQLPSEAVTLVAVTPLAPNQTGLAVTPSAVETQASPKMLATALPAQTQAAAVPDRPVEINQLSKQIGRQILLPGHLPESYKYQSAYYDANHQMVILTYLVTRPLPGSNDPSLTASKTITLLEAQKNDFIPMQVAPATNVTDIQVNNGQPAVYASGAWDAEFVKDDNDPNGGRMVSTWRNDLPVKNIYWQVGDVYLVLVSSDEQVSLQELVDFAASVSQ